MRNVNVRRADLDRPGVVVRAPSAGSRQVFELEDGRLVQADEPPAGTRYVWTVLEQSGIHLATFRDLGVYVQYRFRVVDPVAVIRAAERDALQECEAVLEPLARELISGGSGRPITNGLLRSQLSGREPVTPHGLKISVIGAGLFGYRRPDRSPEPDLDWSERERLRGLSSEILRPTSGAPAGDVAGRPHAAGGGTQGHRPPSEGAGGRAVPMGGRRERPRPAAREPGAEPARQLVVQMPAGVPTGEQLGLQVRIVSGRPDTPLAAAAPMRPFAPRPGGTDVTVVVHAGSGLTADGPLLQIVRVPEHGDSDPLLFAFRAVAPGLHRVDVKAYAGGSFLAELRAEVSVADRGLRMDASARQAPIGPLTAVPGEVTLQVQADSAGHYVFQILSDRTQFSPVSVTSLTGPAGPAVEQVLAALSRLARGGGDHTDPNAREWLKQSGVNLWTQLVPAAVKEQFFQVRDAMSAFTIASGHDLVPWELLHPLRPGHDDGFLIEQVPVVRRVFDQARSRRIGMSAPRYVVPEGRPSDALDEVAAIEARLGPSRAGVVEELDELLALLAAGRLGMAHFACHDNYRAEAGGSSIRLRNGSFLPVMLAAAAVQRSLAAQRPLIFINACRSASQVPQYTQMMGWAKQFIAAGAGAFVGTLWDIRSHRAAAFADGFYQRLCDGRTLGQAAHETRLEAARDRADPTWLAYSVYGDPAATAAR